MKNKDTIRSKVNIEENIVIFFSFLPRKEKDKPKIIKKTRYDKFLLNTNNNPPALIININTIKLSIILCLTVYIINPNTFFYL